jgi:hypothetical protein
VLSVLDESGRWLIDVARLAANLRRQGAVLIPAAMEKLHETDAALDHATCEQAVACETAVVVAAVDAIQFADHGDADGAIDEAERSVA